MKTVEKYAFDGIVLEIPVVEQVVPLIQSIKRALGTKLLILVLPPVGLDEPNSRIFNVLKPLIDSVDRFSLNMYDYSTGPNAPTGWIQRCQDGIQDSLPALLPKVLMGIPFYGYDTKGMCTGMLADAHLMHCRTHCGSPVFRVASSRRAEASLARRSRRKLFYIPRFNPTDNNESIIEYIAHDMSIFHSISCIETNLFD